ncbi:MAG: arginine--tRNA ligase [Chthoniobacterales bacterium]
MMTVRHILEARLRDALVKLSIDPDAAEVSAAADTRFGDYQSNSAMALAKRERQNPRVLATRIAESIDVSGISAAPEIAGAGFLNFRLETAFLQRSMEELSRDTRAGCESTPQPKTIVIDFSSPNVAKPMHVGHIRSTILGDCLARIARFLGHRVITDNHIGDWGTQFGKIIYGWKHLMNPAAFAADPIPELLRLYRDVNALEASDESVKSAVREELVKLQSGDAENLSIWQEVVATSLVEFQKIYAVLDVRFDEHLGESFYNAALAPLVDRCIESGLARESEGAICIFYPEASALAEHPCVIRKSDGGFLYATTDLATIAHRIDRWNPDAIWYVTGSPQALHFQQVFEAARMMGLKFDAQHIPFGSILGEDRKIMKTRSGENVQLGDVLAEAVERARAVIAQKNPELSNDEADPIARAVGIGAVKYSELSQHRMTDYVFSWEKMLSFQGNTAPYLQNACVRIRSIFRRLESPSDLTSAKVNISTDRERALAVKLLQFGEVVPAVLDDFRPNLLVNYLYELATTFHSFYESCPVLKSEGDVRTSRLVLCDNTLKTLITGLDLLGIRAPERM